MYFVVAGLSAAIAVALHLLGPRVADFLGGGTAGTIVVVAAWVLTAASALLLYRGMMRAAQEQDEAEARRVRDLAEWHNRRQPGPPFTHL